MNVLLVTLDQFRGDCLSAAGHPVVRTPNLDRLAAQGVRLSRHYSQASPCSPGRACLYTGSYQLNNRVVANGTPLGQQAHALGLGTCWNGGLDRKSLAGLLRLPDTIEIIGLLSVGFPAESPAPRRRKHAAEVAHYNVYGNHDPSAVVTAGHMPGGWLARLLQRLRFNRRV